MNFRALMLAGAALLALSACEGNKFNPFGDKRAGAPDASLADAPSAVPIQSDNAEMSAFMTDNLIHLRKYPRALRVAVVVGAQPMDLKAWPGAIVADEIETQAKKCGTPVEYVGVSQDFDLLVGFAHRERDGAQDQQDHEKLAEALTRNRMRAAQSLADILDVELEVKIETDIGNAKGEYPYDRWHQFLNYKVPENAKDALLPRLPVETWREHYDKVIAEIGPMAPDSQGKKDRTEEFRSSYLNEVMAICPNNFYADLMARARVSAPPDLVSQVMRDGRLHSGMSRDQFRQASITILTALRPGR